MATAISASSPQQQGIIAIVNDDVISSHDLNSRMALFLATSNAEDTPENRRRLAPEVLRTLIDDVLKRQEMRRRNITVSQSEIDRSRPGRRAAANPTRRSPKLFGQPRCADIGLGRSG